MATMLAEPVVRHWQRFLRFTVRGLIGKHGDDVDESTRAAV
jgi:hypothetical protein